MMARRERTPPTLLQQLVRAAESLPASTERHILERGEAVVPELIELLMDVALSDREAPGGGYVPVHAAHLLGRVGSLEATEPLLTVLAAAEPGDVLFEGAMRALEALGPEIGPALLVQLEGTDDADGTRGAALMELAVRLQLESPLLYERALRCLDTLPGLGAYFLQRYGSEADLPAITAKLDALLRAVEEGEGEGVLYIDVSDLAEAEAHFTPTPSAERIARVEAVARRLLEAERGPQPASASPKIGRNDPCPCGSGKKYKKCHWPEDEAKRVG